MIYSVRRCSVSWRLPDGVDRLMVNAALTKLTECWHTPSANTTVYAFRGLPTFPERQYETILWHRDPKNHADIRLVEVSDDGRSVRVGAFRVLQFTDREIANIEFRRPSDDAPEGPPSPTWQLAYQRSSLATTHFVRFDFVPERVSWRLRMLERLKDLWRGQRTVVMSVWEPKRTFLFVDPHWHPS